MIIQKIIFVTRFELEDLSMRPDPEPLLVEKIHAAAYRYKSYFMFIILSNFVTFVILNKGGGGLMQPSRNQ